ncbi:MAG: transpeptidase family protein [Acidobacteria bacterium]|nr:transpeptidase family protein [Acidobacteriota bacterium]MBI3657795.1 transpeptidase family protein [Acidobacteriota bacterium]
MTDGTPLQQEARLYILVIGVLLWFLVIIGRLTYVQVLCYDRYAKLADEQQRSVIEVNAKRGVVYDRNRHELAISTEVSSVYANPRMIVGEEAGAVAEKLSKVLALSPAFVLRRLTNSPTKAFVWIKRKISNQEAAGIVALGIPGVDFIKEDQRFYPNAQLAAHVLGFVDTDNKGLAGLEQLYDADLRGTSGVMTIRRDAKQHSFRTEIIKPAITGKQVVLSISRPVQYAAEAALAEVMRNSHAIAGTIIVMDPHTGQVLAMANEPTYDPNQYQWSDAEVRRNRAISDAFEPGSTFKVLIAAAALEENLARPEETIDCQMGSILVGRHRFHDHKRFGVLSVSDIIAKSSDVGAIKLGLRLGTERLYQYVRTFGIGQRTGIDLPGEHFGLFQPPHKWSGISIGAISFGQEVGVTALQMLRAVGAIANGGYLVKPYVVERIEAADGRTVYQAQPFRTPILSSPVAEAVTDMMHGVVEHGTAKKALMQSYSAGGKTGTAQKIINGAYSRNKYVASFVGFAPAENPAMAAIVVLDEPIGKYHGGDIAAPVFKQVSERVLISMGVQQTKEPILTTRKVGKARQKPVMRADSSRGRLDAPAQEVEWTAASRSPAAAQTKERVIIAAKPGMTMMPDFRGKSLREVSQQCNRLGITLKPIGSGLALAQDPPPGSLVGPGMQCQLRFGIPGSAGEAGTRSANDRARPNEPKPFPAPLPKLMAN